MRFARSLAACAALFACRSAPPAVPTAQGGEAADYYPLAVGNSWTYDLGGGRQETIRIVGRDGAWFLDDHRGRLRHDSEGVRDGDRYLLRSPLRAGSKWQSVENLVVQKFEIVATDSTAVTPAGTFTGCVVVRNEQAVQKDRRFVTEWTYAPRVGLVQIVTSTESSRGASAVQSRLQLAAFRVP